MNQVKINPHNPYIQSTRPCKVNKKENYSGLCGPKRVAKPIYQVPVAFIFPERSRQRKHSECLMDAGMLDVNSVVNSLLSNHGKMLSAVRNLITKETLNF